MAVVRVTRSATVPDPVRVARYEKSPELGPRILFFSGGTALNGVARHLTRFTHNSIHIVTSFDSGGSSAKLREAFHMPAVGDLRSRIMALADRTVKGHPEIVRLFSHRLPKDAAAGQLRRHLQDMVSGADSLVSDVPYPMRDIIRNHLKVFADQMPTDFDLRGASIGNLILTGGYLANGREIDPVVFLFSRLVEARGTVVPVFPKYLELAAELEDGRTIVGQHNLTGKESQPIDSPIRRIFLRDPAGSGESSVEVSEDIRSLIRQADLICFAMGSFYSSILVNLLPNGVAKAIRANGCPKVYVPNTGVDPEQFGMSVAACVRRLQEYLSSGTEGIDNAEPAISLVVMDQTRGTYAGGDAGSLEKIRIPTLNVELIGPSDSVAVDETLLVPVLLSLV